mmetsp:Transcript_40433/g.106705  ORF Transcript_40433/g.106705 Transcript_40433/m.106705 type:complete len:206 (-) Transcript_40433:83-700(-)
MPHSCSKSPSYCNSRMPLMNSLLGRSIFRSLSSSHQRQTRCLYFETHQAANSRLDFVNGAMVGSAKGDTCFVLDLRRLALAPFRLDAPALCRCCGGPLPLLGLPLAVPPPSSRGSSPLQGVQKTGEEATSRPSCAIFPALRTSLWLMTSASLDASSARCVGTLPGIAKSPLLVKVTLGTKSKYVRLNFGRAELSFEAATWCRAHH